LAARPRLLLLDEPTSALDESLQQEVVALLTEARQQGATIIGIMHDLALLHRIADEVMTMAHGRVTSIAAAR
ncbi:MAG: ABC transporter ATP-binding protein, partial [Dehalococcoidia bacterium]|nr:ABC transporter ATP-binding protein [Dehalococcoidia bacterium]